MTLRSGKNKFYTNLTIIFIFLFGLAVTVFIVSKQVLFSPKAQVTSLQNLGIKVATVKYYSTSYNLAELEGIINQLVAVHPDLDLVVTPEYALYKNFYSPTVVTPITFNQQYIEGVGEIYTVALGQDSLFGVSTIKMIQNVAKQKQINFVLGTVPEKMLDNYIFNSQLIINKDGYIVGIRRKTFDIRPTETTEAYNFALNSVKSYILSTKDNNYFSILPIICGERFDINLMAKAANLNVDVLVGSDQEADYQMAAVTQSVQNNNFNPSLYGWTSVIRDNFIAKYVNQYKAVKIGGYFVLSEGGLKESGIISLTNPPIPLDSFESTDKWFVARLASRTQTLAPRCNYFEFKVQ